MSDSDQRPEIEAPDELLADMPLPSDAKTFFLGGIFVLATLTAAYVARDIVLPMIFAVMLNLLMQPALSALERLRVPRVLGSILLILVVFATIVGIGAAVSGPAEAWIAKLPEGIPRIEERLRFLDAPINTLRNISGGGQQFRRRGPAAKLARAFGRRSDSVERLCRDAKLRRRAVHDRDVSLLPASGGGQFPAAARRGFAQVRQQAAGGRHLAANRTRYFRLSPHNYHHERACRRRDRPCHVVDRSRRSRSMGDGRIHSELCSDSRARRSFFHFPVRRLAHDRLDLASPAPGGALCRAST